MTKQRHVQWIPKVPAKTIAGFGYLREAPRPHQRHEPAVPIVYSHEQVLRRAALRKCMYLPAYYPGSPGVVARVTDRVKTDPGLFRPPLRRRATPENVLSVSNQSSSQSRWDDPLSVGILLAALPPLGFALLWSSKRFSRDAKIAVTAFMMMLFLLATTALCTALIVLR